LRGLKPGVKYRKLNRPNHPLAMANGLVYEHRMIAWDAGLFDDPSWEVHHINGDPADNRLENLEALPSDVHHERHAAPPAPCSVEECDRDAAYRRMGLCELHAQRVWRHGSTDLPPKPPRKPRILLPEVEIVTRWDAGESVYALQRRFGVSTGPIHRILRSRGRR
jgi:hypothetical protein